jgi:prefoldin subunit 5
MHDMKEEINKNIEILKNNQPEINSSIYQIKISIQSLANRVKEVENRVSGTEDKEELDQRVKHREKMLRKYEWNIQDI